MNTGPDASAWCLNKCQTHLHVKLPGFIVEYKKGIKYLTSFFMGGVWRIIYM